MRKLQDRETVIALTFALALGGFLIGSACKAHAQEPNRQLVQTGPTNANAGKRIALVIGNGGYTTAPPLKNPPNDGRDMAATLKLPGFSVSSAIDADQRTMKRLIREFGQQPEGKPLEP